MTVGIVVVEGNIRCFHCQIGSQRTQRPPRTAGREAWGCGAAGPAAAVLVVVVVVVVAVAAAGAGGPRPGRRLHRSTKRRSSSRRGRV